MTKTNPARYPDIFISITLILLYFKDQDNPQKDLKYLKMWSIITLRGREVVSREAHNLKTRVQLPAAQLGYVIKKMDQRRREKT